MIGKAFPKPTGYDGLRTFAVARLFLDNFDHVKAYWVSLGERLAQAALSFGVDDVDGTVLEERIYHMAGATTPQALSEAQLHRMIRVAGRVPGGARQPLPRAPGPRRARAVPSTAAAGGPR